MRCKSEPDHPKRTRLGAKSEVRHTFVDVGGVGLLSCLIAFLFLPSWGGGLLACFLLLGGGFAGGSLTTSRGLLLGGFWRHFDGFDWV